MKNKKLLSLYTFLSVMSAICIIGFFSLPLIIDYVQVAYYGIQLDVNKRQSEIFVRIIENRLQKNADINDVISELQMSIAGTDIESGFVCITDSNLTFISHPDSNLIGKTVENMGLRFYDILAKAEKPWEDILKKNVSVSGILKAPDNHSEIVYSKKIEGFPWLINSHENTRKIDAEVESLRESIVFYSIIIAFLIALLASLFVRAGSRRYEEKIESINILLEDRVNKLNRANSELENLNIEKNEMLSIVAHDLKSPLSGIILSIDLIKNYFDKFSKADLIEKLNSIGNTSKHMSEIITQLLDIDFIENGKVDLRLESFKPNPLLAEVIESFNPQIAKKDIELIDETATENREAEIYADRNVFRELAGNLISNAIKFSPPKSKISYGLKHEDDKLVFYVKDEGPGLNDADMGKLFSKFAKMSAKPTAGENSTGLGLYIVKKLTELMKGSVWVESVYGKGAVFYLSFSRVK